ncbi:MAG: hypothetical protein J6P93_04110, partial [Alphaproteobacteria bacterium]|nr:hypothetical protein [Alphaproteobacteria bacterium]
LSEGMRDFAFVCQTLGQTYFVIMNATDKSVQYRLKNDISYQCLLDTAEKSTISDGNIQVAPWGFTVLLED